MNDLHPYPGVKYRQFQITSPPNEVEGNLTPKIQEALSKAPPHIPSNYNLPIPPRAKPTGKVKLCRDGKVQIGDKIVGTYFTEKNYTQQKTVGGGVTYLGGFSIWYTFRDDDGFNMFSRQGNQAFRDKIEQHFKIKEDKQ